MNRNKTTNVGKSLSISLKISAHQQQTLTSGGKKPNRFKLQNIKYLLTVNYRWFTNVSKIEKFFHGG